jgi:tetratricopeptide (TPR) repeat protein
VLDLLAQLVEKSLVVAEALDEGGTRYRLLETLRHYGRARLETGGEPSQARHWHAAYYLTLAERVEPELTGSAQLRWLDHLEREHDNLRAALAWWLERAEHGERDEATPAAEACLRLAGALFWFWFVRDHHPEALAWLDRALARGAAAPASVRAKALFGAGVFAWSLNDLARSEALLTRSAALSRAVGDGRARVLALGALGFTMCQNGRDEQGAAVVEESIAVAREAGDRWLLAYALLHRLLRVAYGPAIERDEERTRARAAGDEARPLFQVAGDAMSVAEIQLCMGELALRDGDYERAKAALRSALPVMRAVGWRTSVADGLVRLGDVARQVGDVTEATGLYLEALELYRQSGRRLGASLLPHLPAVLCHLADMALAQGDREAAQTHVGESLTITRDTHHAGGPHVPGALEVRAALAAVQDAPLRAIRLAGAAASLRARLNQPLAASERATLEWRLVSARRALRAEEQARAWAAGEALTPEQAVAEALAADGPDSA